MGEAAGQTKPLAEPTCCFYIGKVKITGKEKLLGGSTFSGLSSTEAFVTELFEGRKSGHADNCRELH